MNTYSCLKATLNNMPYIVDWLVEGKVLYTQFCGALDMETLHASNTEKNLLLTGLTERVTNIVDVRLVTRYPISLSQLKQASTVVGHPNVKITCTMVSNSFLRTIVATVANAIHADVKVFPDEEAVLNYLREAEPGILPDDLVAFPAKLACHCE
jgi:hypothetical protein